jgi:hypothetical protein
MRRITLTRIGTTVCIATGIVWLVGRSPHVAADTGGDAPQLASTAEISQAVAALKADIERLKGMVPDQSHAMKDVAYHFANLWFAAQSKNWPLAEFYWAETRSHLRWAVRIIPVRKDPQGQDIRLAEILDPIERTTLEEVHRTIREQNGDQFPEAYTQMLGSCYACHVAAGKPFLRLQIPQQPEVPIIRFAPEP